jgi:hypothetical protein
MHRRTDAELAARCRCGVPIDEPTNHAFSCPIRQRSYNDRRPLSQREIAKRAAARTIARQFAAARIWLASGGRPAHEAPQTDH